MLLLVMSCLLAGAQAKADTVNAGVEKKRPKVALVLSGGGARGLAHVGVAKALDRMRIPYDCIAGTSMGAIAGGTFASGTSLEEAERLVVEADWRAVFADKPRRSDIPYFRKYEDYKPYFDFSLTMDNFRLVTPRNFVGVQNIGLFFRELTGAIAIESFDDLPLPYRAVGTDIITGEAVLITGGTVAEAMRASMTVPGVFPPIPYKGHLLVDGGLSRNLPISTGRELCGEVVIAVNVSTPGYKQDDLTSFLTIGEQVINISMQHNMNAETALLTERDVLIVPKLDEYTSADFPKVRDLVRRGEEAVEASATKLQHLQVSEAEYAEWKQGIENRRRPLPVVRQVKVAETKWVNPQVMQDLLRVKPGQPFNMKALHQNISRVYARGDFASLRYDLVDAGTGQADITITPEEKGGRDFLRFGLGLYSDFEGDATFSTIVSLRRAWLNRLDAEWRTDLQLGRDNGIYSEWYQPASLGSEFFVAPYVLYSEQHRDFYLQNTVKLEYEYLQAGAGLELGSVFGRWGEFRAGVRRSYGKLKVPTFNAIPDETFQQGGYTLRTIYDQLDNTHFPHEGGSARLNYFKSSTSLDADTEYDRLEFRGTRAVTRGRNTILATVRVGDDLGTDLPNYDNFSIGGLFNLSAYPNNYFEGGRLRYGGLVAYRRISDLPAALGKGIYGGIALEGARIGRPSAGYAVMDEAAYSGSVYLAADTVLGPFYLLGALGNKDQSALYMALGISF